MDQDDEPNVWLTVLKLVVGAVVIIGGLGLVLWWAGEHQMKNAPDPNTNSSKDAWGIVHDSPVNRKR
ncbi:hypothetical protein [Rhodoferax aquaticus]|uniref:Uncharacterized protein n=1 Tax=Rhodoferax aquaticus TaxID=2527691 RepID=A0A515EJI1_9BURK|nr:hypothetical protein [Rhodoferax aquaticus]QDL52826.1 hypothetical protein EXZ61_00780 [Rhodoferax aquaticus]